MVRKAFPCGNSPDDMRPVSFQSDHARCFRIASLGNYLCSVWCDVVDAHLRDESGILGSGLVFKISLAM